MTAIVGGGGVGGGGGDPERAHPWNIGERDDGWCAARTTHTGAHWARVNSRRVLFEDDSSIEDDSDASCEVATLNLVFSEQSPSFVSDGGDTFSDATTLGLTSPETSPSVISEGVNVS